MENVTSLSQVISSLDYSALQTNILLVIGATAGIVVGMIAIKKGYAFLKRQIKGA